VTAGRSGRILVASLVALGALVVAQGCGSHHADANVHISFVFRDPVFILNTNQFTPGVVGRSLVRQFSASGGTPPYTWASGNGSLAPGLVLDPPTGRISGTPTAAGTFDATISVTDRFGSAGSVEFSETVITSSTSPQPFRLIQGGLTTGIPIGQEFAFVPGAEGPSLPFVFSATPLPPGISFDPTTGLLSGTPSQVATTSITLRLVNAAGMDAVGSPATLVFATAVR
jgi:hypothetical protein